MISTRNLIFLQNDEWYTTNKNDEIVLTSDAPEDAVESYNRARTEFLKNAEDTIWLLNYLDSEDSWLVYPPEEGNHWNSWRYMHDYRLTEEESQKYFRKPAKEMFDKFEQILTDAGLTKENVIKACNLGCAYCDFFDETGELSEDGKKLLEIWKDSFGDPIKECTFVNWLDRN